MTVATAQYLDFQGNWADKTAEKAGTLGEVQWYRWGAFDAINDTATDAIAIGPAKALRIHIGTVSTPIATNTLTLEVQAGNPDGVFQDTGNQITLAAAASTADVVTIFDPPSVVRLAATGTAPTAGALNIYLEVRH